MVEAINKQTALAIFVKTSEISPVKTRLAKDIGKDNAIKFYNNFIKILQNKLVKLPDNIVPYWAIAEKEALSHPKWQDFNRIHSGYGDLGARLANVYNNLLKKYGRVIIIGSDTPQISMDLINNVAAELVDDFQIGPSDDGGFYLFAGTKEIPEEIWLNTKYSLDTTLADLSEKLELISKIKYQEKLRDIDNIDDLLTVFGNMCV